MARRSPSPSAMSGTSGVAPRSAKRHKIFRACATCVASKTRCEDVTPEGCALCRRRARVCSLAAIATALEANGGPVGQIEARPGLNSRGASFGPSATPNGAHPNSYDSGTEWHTPPVGGEVEMLRKRLAETERRVAHTEAALAEVEARLRREDYIHHGNGGPRPSGDSPAAGETVQLAGPLRFATIMLYRLDESMFSVGSTRVYPDPVLRGIVPASHVELAWHGFKARISALLPLPPFLAVSTPVPAHGFVVLAALYHVPSQYSRALEPLLNESVLLAMSGATSVEVILALLILSLAPMQPEPEEDTPSVAPVLPSPFRLISLAYHMGQGLGFEAMAEAALERGHGLNVEHNGEQLWNLQLWAAIVNRFCLLSLMHGQSTALPPRVADRLPVLARDSVEMCNRHLRAEASVIAMFEPVARCLCALEHANNYDLESLHRLPDVWGRATDQVKHFLRDDHQPPPVQRDAITAQFAFGVRFASLTTWIPSPLREAREIVLPCLSNFPAIMTQMLEMVSTAADIATFPSYVVMVACAALLCFRRAVQFVRLAYSQTSLIDSRRLDDAERRLMTMGRMPRFLLTEAKRIFTEITYSPSWEGAAPPVVHNALQFNQTKHCNPHSEPQSAGPPPVAPQDPLTNIDFDIMNWDLSFLYPDFAALSSMANQMR